MDRKKESVDYPDMDEIETQKNFKEPFLQQQHPQQNYNQHPPQYNHHNNYPNQNFNNNHQYNPNPQYNQNQQQYSQQSNHYNNNYNNQQGQYPPGYQGNNNYNQSYVPPPPQINIQVNQNQESKQQTRQVFNTSQMPQHSVEITCPSCKNRYYTRVVSREENANITIIVWVLMVIVFFPLIICAIPAIMQAKQKECTYVEHRCNGCNFIIGTSIH